MVGRGVAGARLTEPWHTRQRVESGLGPVLSEGAGGGGLDGADDVGGFLNDLVGDLAAVDFDIAGEVEGHTDAFAFDGCDAHDPDGVSRIADDDFLAFTSCDDQHCVPPMHWLERDHRSSHWNEPPAAL